MKIYRLLLLLSVQLTHGLALNGRELPVPQGLSVKHDLVSQTLSLTWQSESSLFDIQIYRTELMELILNETVRADSLAAGRRGWRWRSAVPLECTSHSVQIRARDQQRVSQWSPLQTIAGFDLPDRPQVQMFPQDKVVLVGSSITFCCIVPEGRMLDSIRYSNKSLDVSMLSRRTFAATVTDLPASGWTGTNVICYSKSTILSGAVVFVGYPPGDADLVCETRDLVSAECQWMKGRDTHFWRTAYLTKYTLNGQRCGEASRNRKQCNFKGWEDSWTLLAQNPLGVVQLNDSAPLTERVRLLAPVNVSVDPQAWNASLQWTWSVDAYKNLDLVCQVQLENKGDSSTQRNYTGVGLSAVFLDKLRPDVEYAVSVRCASSRSFWRWGDWSAPYSTHTKMDRPEAPDVWVWMNSESTGRVMWKPLPASESHGMLDGYEVSRLEDDRWETLSFPPNVSSASISFSNLSSGDIIAMAARNLAGKSDRSVMPAPEFRADYELPVSELAAIDGALQLSWQPWSNASRGYVVEWLPTGCTDPCPVQWLKVPKSKSSTSIGSEFLDAGVRYTVSVFALSPESAALMQRHYGYGQELVPARPVTSLSASQSKYDILLSWDPVPISGQRGFVRGYTIYRSNASGLEFIANLTDPSLRSYRVKGLAQGSYKFLVKAYTSAGEGVASTFAIQMQSDTDMLIVEILLALGIMSFCLIFISIFCYKKREWVKKAFYPEIPGPKLTGDWTAPPGPLDIKPPPHSLVHIVESPDWDSAKRELITVPEEGSNDDVEADTDSDEPALLRYYNQLVGDSSHGNRHLDTSGSTSTSSLDSAQTQVTYAGIQSPTSAHGAPAYGYRPQMKSEAEPGELENPGFENTSQEESPTSVGYKPQCVSWAPDSPEAEDFSGSLGSPTSVTSSQFLIPESPSGSAEENQEPSATWFHNLLSGKF